MTTTPGEDPFASPGATQGYGSYGPPPGYGAPPQGWTAPPATPSSEDTVWAGLAHLSGFLIPVIGPLVVYLVKKDDSPHARQHGAEALNFHLTVLIGFVVSAVLTLVLIGILGLIFLSVWSLVLTIVAAVKGFQGQPYRYPATFHFLT
jgi:uncharacterized Tic20 family protein